MLYIYILIYTYSPEVLIDWNIFDENTGLACKHSGYHNFMTFLPQLIEH